MDRLQFLKAFGLTLGGGVLLKRNLLAAPLPAAAEATERFKPGPEGRILVNRPGTSTWDVHAQFGPDYEVLAVRQEREGTFADLRFQGHPIRLGLDAGRQHWTVQ